MKTTLTLLASLAFAVTAQAGEDYSAKGGKEVIPPPPAPTCLWSWFAGGSAGTIGGDWDEEIYTLHLGTERKCTGQPGSHAFFLEVGYTEKDGTVDFRDPNSNSVPRLVAYDVSIDIIPITLNYKYESVLTGNLNWYAGAGAGIAITDIDIRGRSSDSETAFYAHVFAGLVYNFSESFEVFGGARYIFMDDIYGLESPLDQEIQYELGARFNF